MNATSIIHWFIGALIAGALVTGCKSPEKLYTLNKSQAPFDAIIVPGVPYDTAWSRTMKGRVMWSYHLYKRGIARNIIYSGSAVYTPYVESVIMAEYAKALGIPETHIFTEENAEHSTENLSYSVAIARQQGFEKVALATDPYQNAMLKSFAGKQPIDVHFIPFIADTLNRYYKDVKVSIDPAPAYRENFVALPDREGFFKRLLGTMGFNVKEEYAQPDVSVTSSKE